MGFQVSGLKKDQFKHLYGKDDKSLAKAGARRMTVDEKPGYPCRVSLEDVEIGETVLLFNYEHLPTNSPYRSSHAIFVKEGASHAEVARNEVPESLRMRLLSVRAFDDDDMMIDADVVPGNAIEPVIERMLANDDVSFLHLHNAMRGCYAARVDRYD
jgi:hypothetical protein